MADTKKESGFEEKLRRLDEIVRLLERGEVSLEESLKLYTEGAELIRLCTVQLDQAEQMVVRLQKGSDGEPIELPFDVEQE